MNGGILLVLWWIWRLIAPTSDRKMRQDTAIKLGVAAAMCLAAALLLSRR